MVIKPKFKGFICTTSHPEGCKQTVINQINYVKHMGKIKGAQNVLIIGASTGYGLASRIVSAFGLNAKTIGVFFEREATENKPASAGWYNTVFFEKYAHLEGIYAKSINGDAFSLEVKQKTIDLIKKDLGKVDLVIYSVAAPKRIDPVKNEMYNSVLKPIGKSYVEKTVDFHTNEVSYVTLEPATEFEIQNTIKVMGGEDWLLWMKTLVENDCLCENAKTVAYSYLGSELTYPIYKNGTIGKAKEHLEKTVKDIDEILKSLNGKAYVSINKALVTQASCAIPVVSLYISLLYKVMKEKNIHEDTIHQIYRLFKDYLYSDQLFLDSEGRIRLDTFELREDVQAEVKKLWKEITSENVTTLTDISSFRKEFFNLFGFEYANVNYDEDVEHKLNIPSIF